MDQTTNALLGISKTLADVVGPAIRADDPLAQQELRMAIRYLDFLRVRVEHLHARARYELQFHTDLARRVSGLLGASPTGEAMAGAAAGGETVLTTPGATLDEVRQRSGLLVARLTEVVRDEPDAEVRAAVEKAVVAASERMTAFERSWYLPMGLDHFPFEVAPVESFLSQAGRHDTDDAGA